MRKHLAKWSKALWLMQNNKNKMKSEDNNNMMKLERNENDNGKIIEYFTNTLE